MKCIQCSTENNLKDRTANQGRCSSCNHPFAFEPTAMKDVKITDPFFMKAIADLSSKNTLFFTPKQFLYFLDKRSKRKSFNFPASIAGYLFFCVWTIGFVGGLLSMLIKSIPIATTLIFVLFNIGYINWLFSMSNSPKSSQQTRKDSATAMQIIGGLILAIALGLSSVKFRLEFSYLLAPAIAISAIILGTIQKRRVANISDSFIISSAQAIDLMNTWARVNGAIAKMLPKPDLALPATGEISNQNNDVTDYSFDRLVVCNSTEIAQMLIVNNFHFENNCAILSSTGYPATVFDTVLQMLRRNPELRVYAFHDASPDGVKLVHELLTSPRWFQEYSATIIDLGLLPRQVLANSRNLFIHRTTASGAAASNLNPEIRQTLTVAELAWLDAGNYVELESFPPQKLIQVLNLGISNRRELDPSADGGVIWMGDDGSNIYAVESFG